MNFKLDENLGPTVQEIFIRRGHDCRTVREQNLGGAVDALVLEAAVSEGRILVTTDHDFGNILIYPPSQTSGIAILSPPGEASRSLLRLLANALLSALEQKAIRGRLWIVEPARIREHEPDELNPV
jgi:predicted nuclease of predicted toxin-antitoxin system